MSIVSAVFVKILAGVKNWRSLTESHKSQLFSNAYFMFGRPFLQALTEIETNKQGVIIIQHSQFITVELKKKKQIIFYKKNTPLQIQCTCQVVWSRKTCEKSSLLCKHEALYILWKYCFHEEQQQADNTQSDNIEQLLELISRIQE